MATLFLKEPFAAAFGKNTERKHLNGDAVSLWMSRVVEWSWIQPTYWFSVSQHGKPPKKPDSWMTHSNPKPWKLRAFFKNKVMELRFRWFRWFPFSIRWFSGFMWISPQKNATNKSVGHTVARVFPTQKHMFEAVSAIRHWGISLSGHAHIKYNYFVY